MQLYSSYVSCGINELRIDPHDKPTKASIEKVLFAGAISAMVIANIPTSRKGVILTLKNNGFKPVKTSAGADGVKHTFLVRRFNAADISRAKKEWKKRYNFF